MASIEHPTAAAQDPSPEREHRAMASGVSGPPADPSPMRLGGAVLAAGAFTVLASGLVNPGPGLAHVHAATYVAGHLLNGTGYLLLVLGIPVLVASLNRSLGPAGYLGYAALAVRYVLSTGSQLFQATVFPQLADHPDLHTAMAAGGRLSTIYGSWSDAVTLVLSVVVLGLVWSLWRAGRTLRAPAVLLLLSALANPVITPLTLVLVSVALGWLGLRVALRGDVRSPLRTRPELFE